MAVMRGGPEDWEAPESRPAPPSVGEYTRRRAGTDYCAACDASGPAGMCCLQCGRVLSQGLPDIVSRYVLYWKDHCYACGRDVIVRQDAGTRRPPMICRVCGSTDVGRFNAKEEERKEERRRAAGMKEW